MTTDQTIIKNKLGVLRLAEMLGNVSEACRVMGYSRDSFYRFKELYGTADYSVRDLAELFSISRPRVYRALERQADTTTAASA